MKKTILVCMVAAVFAQAFGQTSASAAPAAPPAPAMKDVPFVQQIRKTVTFIQLRCQHGTEVLDVRGTGFLVMYPDERVGKDGGFTYLVTNRHVALCWDDDRQPMAVNSISIRLNLTDGSSTTVLLSPAGNVPWILPADDSVDLALLPLRPDEKKVEYKSIPLAAFATDDVITSRGIAEGTKIIFTGFFYQFSGERKMLPIIREGILAMMPDEKLNNVTGKPGNVYLGDVHIFGGNSGSPVFVDLGGVRGNVLSVEEYHFLGVVSGLFYEDEEFNLKVATTLKGVAHANSGIALIVPAKDLKALLEDRRVQIMRDNAVANHPAK